MDFDCIVENAPQCRHPVCRLFVWLMGVCASRDGCVTQAFYYVVDIFVRLFLIVA